MTKNNLANYILGKAKSYGISSDKLAGNLGISTSTFYRRLRSPETLTVFEILRLKKSLSLSDEEVLYLIGLRRYI